MVNLADQFWGGGWDYLLGTCSVMCVSCRGAGQSDKQELIAEALHKCVEKQTKASAFASVLFDTNK